MQREYDVLEFRLSYDLLIARTVLCPIGRQLENAYSLK